MIIWTIAWRNIWRNKIRSMVIMLSVTIGLLAGIAVLALQVGMLRSRVRTIIEKEVGHLQIHHRDFKNDLETRFTLGAVDAGKLLQDFPQVKAFTTRSIAQGMLVTATGSAGVQVNGISLPEENILSRFNEKIVEGTAFEEQKKNTVIISRKLSDKLKIQMGHKLVLTLTDRENNIISGAFRVSGIFQTVNTPLDEVNVYVRQEDLNALLGTGREFHEIVILLHKDEELESTQENLRKKYPGLLVQSWKEISPETELMVTSINQYTYIIIIIIMLALAFGIVNTMLMAVLERTREMGMMMALGLNRRKMVALIFSETLFLTVAGAPPGILLAWLGIDYFSREGIDISAFSKEAMSSFGFESVIYPEFPYGNIPVITLIVIITAMLSAVLPAVKALRLVPVEALRK